MLILAAHNSDLSNVESMDDLEAKLKTSSLGTILSDYPDSFFPLIHGNLIEEKEEARCKANPKADGCRSSAQDNGFQDIEEVQIDNEAYLFNMG